MKDFEKLGAFYLGRAYDVEQQRVLDELMLYDAKDLTTHAVCVGMTGSGKTGLCVTLLEEAAIDGIPSLVIDPKGDLGNLMLTFPKLRPEDFLPWIDPSEAARKGRSVEEQARATAQLWKQGLAEWGQNGARIARLRKAAEVALYTPGSNAGTPISVLRSLGAPSPAVAKDPDALRERVVSAVSGLLVLAGVDPDPVRSREHILLSAIVDSAWRAGRGIDLAGLIRAIQEPPFERLGVLDLESFFPSKQRFDLALRLNNLLASPAFAAWNEGEPLDISRLLYTPEGRPRIAILSIAHLSEAERMFFVTVLLNEVLAWVRSQPGTSSLRALLYMDEVFGYFPPTANPPSKLPMLTLLKQARAYGLGIVLATQNPVDLDYKGLSNAGTWFLGRLQTERDKARVIEGLEGASAAAGAGFDRGETERILAGLGSRVFLVNNVHEDRPAIFHTRWALSYLRGPMTREQIARLKPAAPAGGAAAKPAAPASVAPAGSARPVLPPKIDEAFLPVASPPAGSERLVYRPALFARAALHYARAAADVDFWENVALLAPLSGDASLRSPWDSASVLEPIPELLDEEPAVGAEFEELPAAASRPATYVRCSKQLKTHLYRERPLRLLRCRKPKALSRPGQAEAEFRAQLRQLGHEKRDLELEKLRKRFGPKLARLEERIRVAEQRVEREQSQYSQQKLQTAVSIGATLLGALFGRKSSSVGRATTAARGAGRAARERGDIDRAEDNLESLQRRLQEMEKEFEAAILRVREASDGTDPECTELLIRPRKTDLAIERVALVWTPWRVSREGIAEPAY